MPSSFLIPETLTAACSSSNTLLMETRSRVRAVRTVLHSYSLGLGPG